MLVYNLVGQMQVLSKLPPQSDICEWLATNSECNDTMMMVILPVTVAALSFFNQINTQYEVVSELCTASTCPTMSAGNVYVAICVYVCVCMYMHVACTLACVCTCARALVTLI